MPTPRSTSSRTAALCLIAAAAVLLMTATNLMAMLPAHAAGQDLGAALAAETSAIADEIAEATPVGRSARVATVVLLLGLVSLGHLAATQRVREASATLLPGGPGSPSAPCGFRAPPS